MIFFLPYGIGDVLMAIPAIKRLLKIRGYDGLTVVVASLPHQKILHTLIDDRLSIFLREDGKKFSQLRLFISMWLSPAKIIVAPLASNSWFTKVFMLLMFRRVYVPSSFISKSLFFFRRIPLLLKNFEGHQVDFYIQFLEPIDRQIDKKPVAYSELALYSRFDGSSSNNKLYRIVLGISCGEAERHKIPSPFKFAQLINNLSKRVSVQVLLIGSDADNSLINTFCNALDKNIFVQKLISLPIDKLALEIANCDLGISGTTGQGHMMSLTQIPMLIFAGVTNPRESGPFVERAAILRHKYICGPCYQVEFKWGCGKVQCMESIDIDEGSKLAYRLLTEKNFGENWRTEEGKKQTIPVHVIKEIHTLPQDRWIL